MLARELVARGHEVEVLTSFPTYPGGNVYRRYRARPWQREQIDGVSILRVALYPSRDKSALGRILNYTSFAISAAVLGTFLVTRPDVIHVYHPPATVVFAAIVLGSLRRAPFIYEIQDLWPDTVAVSGMLSNAFALKLLSNWCKFVYRRASYIAVLSPGFKRQLIRRGVPSRKVDVIYNWCDEPKIQPAPPDWELAEELGLSYRFNVIFAGTMGTAQGRDCVIESAALCQQTLPWVQFVFVGGGVDRSRLEEKASKMDLANVRFLPRQPISAMKGIFALADVLLVHLRRDPLFSITIPSKTQDCMASGKPILMAVSGDAAHLVTDSGGGLVCEPENPESIAATVARFAAMTPEQRNAMGEKGRRYYHRYLSFRFGVDRFEELFEAVVWNPSVSRYKMPVLNPEGNRK